MAPVRQHPPTPISHYFIAAIFTALLGMFGGKIGLAIFVGIVLTGCMIYRIRYKEWY